MKKVGLSRYVLLLSLGFAARPAHAQTDEQRAAARALATEGAAAFNDGRFKDSADLFSRAESLVHAPPHLLFLARSYTKLGQLVRARETYIKITKEQIAPGAPAAFRDAQSAAQDELRAVEPRIAKLTIQINGSQDSKDLAVKVDGNVIPPVLIGIPQPVDPGDHKVEALATGKRAQPQFVSLKDGERGAVTLDLQPDPSAVGAAPAASAVAPVPGAPAPVPGASPAPTPAGTGASPAASGSSGSNGMKIGSYVAFGVGGVGAIVGTVFLLKGASKRSQADDAFAACSTSLPPTCTQSDPSPAKTRVDNLDSEAAKASSIGVTGIIIGGVGLATGVTLLVLSSSGSSSRETAGLVPVLGPRYVGLSGSF